ncbi:metallophosphoesterase [Spirochaeta isovalerica]|uniref:Calcineurin-like phosphoesterase domain-containing protein n=1 Tax=Spirochaeta isovalerica TaxID=150 RepID=A0A841RBY3_9SPIO|nr:metallophosphoesterase [Spirochaeta isovalerica]MBB6480737.1 hypothetical protein [Spirochaeta isovalerica]
MKAKIFFIIALIISTAQIWGNETPFSIVLLPDTQYYTQYHPETYYRQTQWIADNRAENNIQFVIHLGDLTDDNTFRQWRVADRAHTILDDANIPYSVIPGNHDNPLHGKKRNTSRFNRYFGPDRFSGKEWYGGHYEEGNENNYTFFSVGDLHFMVLSLEFLPRQEVLQWANRVIAEHYDTRVIVVTHSYMKRGGDRYDNGSGKYDIEGADGQTIWDKFVKKHSNVFMVLCGHVSDSELRISKGLNGNSVHQILTDFQNEPNGGNGWLRVLQFYPDQNRINVETLSVEKDVNRFFQTSYDSAPFQKDHTFSLHYDMTSRFIYRFDPGP